MEKLQNIYGYTQSIMTIVRGYQRVSQIALIIGTVTLFGISYNVIKSLWQYHLAPSQNLLKRYGKSYVLVTGATQDLGREIAKCFAKRGFDLILIAKESLQDTKIDILTHYPNCDVVMRHFDFETDEELRYVELIKGLDKYDIGIIVNNVSLCISAYLPDMQHDSIKQITRVNVLAPTLITKNLIQRLKSRKEQSAILFTGSQMGIYPQRDHVLYAATQAYVHHLAKSLQLELKNTSIEIFLMAPGLTRRGPPKSLRDKFLTCESKDVAEAVVSKMPGCQFIIGNLQHRIAYYVQGKMKFLNNIQ